MLAEDSRTLRLCWAPTEGRCRWKGAKVTLDDLFHPGGRTDSGAGGRVDETRQGKRLCFNDREAGKAGGACQVEAILSILTLSFVFVELELRELAIISSKLASGDLESRMAIV